MRPDSHAAGVLGMLASTVLFSLMAFLIASLRAVSFWQIALYRFAVGTIALAMIALLRGTGIRFVNTKMLITRGVLGGFAVVIFYLSIIKIGVARGTVISYLYPVFATLGGVLFLKDAVRPVVWILLCASLAGIVLMIPLAGGAASIHGGDMVWILISIIGAVLAGGAIVSIKKLTATDSSTAIFMSQCVFGFLIVAVPAGYADGGTVLGHGVLLVVIGLVATAAQLLMTWSYSKIDISTGSLLSMATPILNLFIGVLVFSELLTAGELAGSGLILLSCAGVVFLRERRKRDEDNGGTRVRTRERG